MLKLFCSNKAVCCCMWCHVMVSWCLYSPVWKAIIQAVKTSTLTWTGLTHRCMSRTNPNVAQLKALVVVATSAVFSVNWQTQGAHCHLLYQHMSTNKKAQPRTCVRNDKENSSHQVKVPSDFTFTGHLKGDKSVKQCLLYPCNKQRWAVLPETAWSSIGTCWWQNYNIGLWNVIWWK